MEPIPGAILQATNAKSRTLRELVHAPEILVMPGAYDVVSALLFEQMGFKAIQGTSGGIAASLGYPDGEVMSRDLFLHVSGKFAAAVSVPFNADGERGYGDENEVKDTVRALVARGVAGMNLEDGAGGKPGGRRALVELPQQLARIGAVMEAKRALGSEFFLNARVDAFHVMSDDPKKALDEGVRRGNAYAEAGGDCIFYLNLHARDIIGTVAKEVQAPISILAGPQSPSVGELQDLGVARVSYGSAFLKAAIGSTKRLAQEILEKGTVTALKEAMQTPEISALVSRKKRTEIVDSKGAVVSIHVASTAAAPMRSVKEVQAVQGKGLEGDRYANKLGTYSNDPGSGRAVTLIESEAVEALKRDYHVKLDAGQSRRNIVTHGISLNHLVGKDFRVGEVRLRGTRLCEPCSHMEELTVKGALRGLVHRGGLRAEVVKSGTIRVGDMVVAASD